MYLGKDLIILDRIGVARCGKNQDAINKDTENTH